MYYLFSCTGLFDGFVARALKANSELGVQLDSLADMVSFGFLPGLTMYKALEGFGDQAFGISLPFDIKYIGLLVTLFSCLRLAIFNLDEDQKYYFKGLNTPSNTICCLVCITLSEKNIHSHFYSKMQDYLYY
jgi:CDP-diacylglycerol--serine O-phosphatidyltransferase